MNDNKKTIITTIGITVLLAILMSFYKGEVKEDATWAGTTEVVFVEARIREDHSQFSKILTLIPEGEEVNLTGKRWYFINIDGGPKDEYWAEVTTNDGLQGWVIGSALE